MAPWVNSRTVSGCPVPNPTCVSPSPAPRDSVTRSRKHTSLVLNPGVFMFARLLPTTSMAVEVAFNAESAVENEVNICFSRLSLRTRSCGGAAVGHELIQIRADGANVLAGIDGLRKLLELR